MPETTFRHELVYPDNHGITLSDIAATLIAHERLIPVAVEILERSFPGLQVEKVSINFDYARTGSLSEALFIAILAVYQKKIDETVPRMVEHLTGIQVPDDLKPILSIIIIILLYYGAKALFERGGKKESAPPHIQGDYNTYINVAAAKMNLLPDTLNKAVEAAAGGKRKSKVARSAIDLFRPAKRGGNGRIISPGAAEIGASAVAEFPDEIMLAELDEDTEIENFSDVILEIRATDRDAADRGCAGRLVSESFATRRLPLKLYPTIDRETLAASPSARVEAIVESRRVDDKLKPIRIPVLKVLD
jgi:hypothetical protein